MVKKLKIIMILQWLVSCQIQKVKQEFSQDFDGYLQQIQVRINNFDKSNKSV